MKFEYASYTDVGKRDNNEDSYRVSTCTGSLLAVVADGLGGHEYGEIASRIAVETIVEDLQEGPVDEDELAYAIQHANEAILAANLSGQTTVAVLWLAEHAAVAAHVGDSRIYQFRDGKILFQSVDHSAVQMAVLIGELKQDATRHHKDRNKLFRVLGVKGETPRVDSDKLTVLPGDRLLLCTDGFWEPVTEEAMLQALAETNSVEQWLNRMRVVVQNTGDPKQDNHTAVCFFVK